MAPQRLLQLDESVLASVLQWLNWRDLCACDSAVSSGKDREHWLLAVKRLDVKQALKPVSAANRFFIITPRTSWYGALKWVCQRGLRLPEQLAFVSPTSRYGRPSDGSSSSSSSSDAALMQLAGANTRHIRKLCLQSCYDLTDAGVAAMATTLEALTQVELSSDKITDAGLAALGKMNSLKQLKLSSSSITDAGLAALATLENLESLSLCAFVTGSGLAHLKRCKQLKRLELSRPIGTDEDQIMFFEAYETGVCITDDGLASLQWVPELQELSIQESHALTDEGLRHLAHLGRLEKLTLRTCSKVTGSGLAHLGSSSNASQRTFSSLTELNVNYCSNVTDGTLAALARFDALARVALWPPLLHPLLVFMDGDVPDLVSDEGLAGLGAMHALKSISFGERRRLGDAGLQRLWGLRSLEAVDLYNCSGPITRAGIEGLVDHCSGLRHVKLPRTSADWADDAFVAALRARGVEAVPPPAPFDWGDH